jgi:hypothetical protein
MKIVSDRKLIAALAILAALVASSLAHAQETPDYYGSGHQEANFSIQSYTYFGKSLGTPTEDRIANDVKTKVKYLLGYMRRNPQSPSSVYPKYKVSTLKIEDTGTQYRVWYQVSGKGVFSPDQASYTFLIPISHSTIYEKAQDRCTVIDGEKVDASTFWYHWDPYLAGCPLKENVDFVKYTTTLSYIANTKNSYPEYDRLFASGTMSAWSFFGVAEYEETNWNPMTSADISARDYIHQRDILMNSYKMSSRVWSDSEVRQYFNGSNLPYIEEFTKNTSKGSVVFRLFFGNTGLDHDSKAFHAFLKIALSNSQVMIYNGHSGIGKNLNLSSIESARGYKLTLNQNYQIYFLGSCVPYAYYTDMFFQRKVSAVDSKGSKNLDIITFGDESIFGNHYDDRLIAAIFDYADNNRKRTYQQIIGTDTGYYLGVNGDEDNPTAP